MPYATPMLHRSVAWSGHIGTRCRAPYGSGAPVCGGVVEMPPHNTSAYARVRMRDTHKWGVERVVGTRIIRAARGGRFGGQISRPTAMTHSGHGWCAQECRIGCRTVGEERVCRTVFTKVPFCMTRGASICHKSCQNRHALHGVGWWRACARCGAVCMEIDLFCTQEKTYKRRRLLLP